MGWFATNNDLFVIMPDQIAVMIAEPVGQKVSSTNIFGCEARTATHKHYVTMKTDYSGFKIACA